ncbi:DUF1127 domain-containing protein [Acidihalobacter aeolianus]|uniref:hypothetical protein n=1 Tax=Acidihalobacter aeolianus TaxID=2792603 RepID=UPI0012EA6D5E|nr:hypothetical protein [Acidihalobacter aeolianus]
MKQRGPLHRHRWSTVLHHRITHWLETRQQRQMLERLLAYDDHQLDDLGYHRQDLLDAIALPWSVDALTSLTRWRQERRAGLR